MENLWVSRHLLWALGSTREGDWPGKQAAWGLSEVGKMTHCEGAWPLGGAVRVRTQLSRILCSPLVIPSCFRGLVLLS